MKTITVSEVNKLLEENSTEFKNLQIVNDGAPDPKFFVPKRLWEGYRFINCEFPPFSNFTGYWRYSVFRYCKLDQMDVAGEEVFTGTEFHNCSIKKSHWKVRSGGLWFVESDLSETNFYSSRLRSTYIENCRLNGVDVSNVKWAAYTPPTLINKTNNILDVIGLYNVYVHGMSNRSDVLSAGIKMRDGELQLVYTAGCFVGTKPHFISHLNANRPKGSIQNKLYTEAAKFIHRTFEIHREEGLFDNLDEINRTEMPFGGYCGTYEGDEPPQPRLSNSTDNIPF